MGWLPSAPQLAVNPLTLANEADRAGVAEEYIAAGLKDGHMRMACEDPDEPKNSIC
jgi:nitrate reductase alpha subunit